MLFVKNKHIFLKEKYLYLRQTARHILITYLCKRKKSCRPTTAKNEKYKFLKTKHASAIKSTGKGADLFPNTQFQEVGFLGPTELCGKMLWHTYNSYFFSIFEVKLHFVHVCGQN